MDAKPEAPAEAPHPSRDASASRGSAAAPRDRPFDGFRVPASERARKLVMEAARRVANYEAHFGLRRRARKARDLATFEATVGAVVADLVHHHLSGQPGAGASRCSAVAIPLAKSKLARRWRHRPAALNNTLPHLLRVMAAPELAILELTLGWHDLRARPERAAQRGCSDRFRQTTMRAGPWLRGRIATMGLGFADLGRDGSEELVILRGRKVPRRGGILKGDLIDYEDAALTVRLREEMRAINAWLAQVDIGLEGSFHHIDTTPGWRRLRRTFNNGRFDHGGRLGGGWWMQLPKAMRREHVRINGERIATLDFDCLYVRLAYARVGAIAPAGDLYRCIPGLEAHRKGAKVLLNSLLFDHGAAPRSRKPMGTAELLPKGVPVGELIRAIERAHQAIAPLFGSGVGFELMNTESNIMVAVLLRLRALGIVGLPVHDALIVARSEAGTAAAVMTMTAEDVASCRLPVTIDAEDEGTEDDELEVGLFEDDGPL
jgi:hypothetical protein